MDAQLLSYIAGALLSLFFSYFPKVREKYATLDSASKSFVMASCLLLISIVIAGFVCTGNGDIIGIENLYCDKAGMVKVLYAFIGSLMANQAVYKISPKLDVKAG